MKFLVPNYNCLQNPCLGGYRPQIPVLSVLCPQLNLLNPHPNKIPGYATGSQSSQRDKQALSPFHDSYSSQQHAVKSTHSSIPNRHNCNVKNFNAFIYFYGRKPCPKP